MANSAVLPGSALEFAPFCDTADARLEQLVSFNPKEAGDFIEVSDLHIPAHIKEFVNPRLAVAAPAGQRDLVLLPDRQQRADIVSQEIGGFEVGPALRHRGGQVYPKGGFR